MICQRCGCCCITMPVVICIDGRAKFKPDGVQCPYLSFEGNVASCSAHDEPWFQKSPCFTYGNPDLDPDYAGTRNRPCRVGELMMKNEPKYQDVPKAGELEDLDEWPEDI